ncbi:hypothetical protein E5288_WYG016935 [Bos mutus]|uniref:Uncharacterized protein n=1 Tax=Bos mutus TaxID=72004 RepID=A0A6B0RUL5_9CETA|nr:hypothetical protein [Bos mutus]
MGTFASAAAAGDPGTSPSGNWDDTLSTPGSLSNSLSSPEDPPPGIYCPWYLLLTRYHCFTPGLYLRTPWKATPPPGSLSGWLISSTTQAGTAKTFSVDPCPQVFRGEGIETASHTDWIFRSNQEEMRLCLPLALS